MSNIIEITDVLDDEMDRCLKLIKLSVIELASDHYSKAQIDAWINQYPSPEEFATWKNRRKMLVASDGKKIVGFGQIEFDRKEIVGVHVAPSIARRGIGSRLVAALENAGVKAGATELVVQASLNAIAFYEACGYKPVREIEFQFKNGIKLDALFMRKQFAAAS